MNGYFNQPLSKLAISVRLAVENLQIEDKKDKQDIHDWQMHSYIYVYLFLINCNNVSSIKIYALHFLIIFNIDLFALLKRGLSKHFFFNRL